jgi:hypothetical protein
MGWRPRPFCTLAFIGAVACHSDSTSPDHIAPAVIVTSPKGSTYDLNGDQLVDVSIAWRDSLSGVDPSTVRIRSLAKTNGPADTSTNLMISWTVVKNDQTGLLVRENLSNLLPDGPNRLEVSVADSAGNLRVDTLLFTLPSVSPYLTIDPQLNPSTNPSYELASDITLDSARHRGFMAVSRTIVEFDTDSMKVIGLIPSGTTTDPLQNVKFDSVSGLVYASDSRGVHVYDPGSLGQLRSISNVLATMGLAFSRVNPSLLYSGSAFDGWLVYANVASNAMTDTMQIAHTADEFEFRICLLSGDQKLYMTRYNDGGILVIDPSAKRIISHVTQFQGHQFFTDNIALSRDDQHLYMALKDAVLRGVADLDTRTDVIVRSIDLSSFVPVDLALSPFLTTRDIDSVTPSKNVVIDVPTWRAVQQLDRHRSGISGSDGPAAFRGDGKLLFVGRDQAIDVYLNREGQ